jgi:predicted  nucleic acid-binding Zn-ribbon protein
LEALIQSRQQELDKMEQAITGATKEIETAKAVVASLKQEKASLEASIRETRERVGREIAKIIPVAQDTIDRLGKEIRRGHDEALVEVRRLRDEALEVGREVGRYEEIVETNQWLSELLALVRSEESLEGKRVRVITLLVLRGITAWLKHHNLEFSSLASATENLIRELERWKV